MNIKLISVAAALAVSAAVAQDYDDEYEEEAPAAAAESAQEEEDEAPAAPAPAPAAPAIEDEREEAPVAAVESAPAEAPSGALSVLHGNAYNMVGNEAAAATIGGDMDAVYKMAGRKLIYVEPSDQYGALSLASGSMTYLLAFDNSEKLGMLTAGIATKGFGVAVDVALDKRFYSNEQKAANFKSTADTTTTGRGDYLAARVGVLLGGMDLTARVSWLTYKNENDWENDNGNAKTEHDEDWWNLGARVALSNGPSAKSLAWSAGLAFARHSDWTKDTQGNTSVEVTGENAYTHIEPFFNLGLPVITAANANVFVGLNTFVPIRIYDEIKEGTGEATKKNNRNAFGLITSPNILGEMALTENWIVFGGANYAWNVFTREGKTIEQGAAEDNTSIITMKTGSTYANAGLRFQYQNFTAEASVADELDSQSWSGLVGHLGVFLTF